MNHTTTVSPPRPRRLATGLLLLGFAIFIAVILGYIPAGNLPLLGACLTLAGCSVFSGGSVLVGEYIRR